MRVMPRAWVLLLEDSEMMAFTVPTTPSGQKPLCEAALGESGGKGFTIEETDQESEDNGRVNLHAESKGSGEDADQ